jgi:hypothetical protein
MGEEIESTDIMTKQLSYYRDQEANCRLGAHKASVSGDEALAKFMVGEAERFKELAESLEVKVVRKT